MPTSMKLNPANVYAIGPATSWSDSPAYMAAYLGFTDMESFRQWLVGQDGSPTSADVHAMMHSYQVIRSHNYGKASKGSGPGSTKGSKTSGVNISMQQVLHLMRDPSAKPLLDPTIGPINDHGLPGHLNADFNSDSGQFAVAIHIAAISHLIHHHPRQFPDSHVELAERKATIGESGLAAEDVHRALLLLKFFWRQIHKGPVGQEGLWLNKPSSTAPVAPISYFTEQDRKKGKEANAEIVKDDPLQRAPGLLAAQAYITAMQETEGAEVEMPDLAMAGPANDSQEARLVWENQLATKLEAAVDAASKIVHRNATRQRLITRAPLTIEQMRSACGLIGTDVRVIHDQPGLGTTTNAVHDGPMVVRPQTLV